MSSLVIGLIWSRIPTGFAGGIAQATVKIIYHIVLEVLPEKP